MAVVNNVHLAPSFGMARGFDVYDLDPPKGGQIRTGPPLIPFSERSS